MLLILDTHALLHRAYHALPPLTNSSGEPVNAVYGLASIVLRLIDELAPTHFIAAHDRPEPSFRHQEYIGYQVRRKKADPDLISQIPLAYELLESFGLSLVSFAGFEADDIIATLIKRLSRPKVQSSKLKATIVTGDRDLFQLISDKVNIYLPLKGLSQSFLVDVNKAREIMGISPSQVVDYKALVGDSSDNYPGIIGIGDKTAVKLLNRYQTLKNIYRHLNDITPDALRNKLKQGREDADLSQRLARLVDNVPLKNLELNHFSFDFSDTSRLESFFRKQNFRSLLGRLQNQKNKKMSNLQKSMF